MDNKRRMGRRGRPLGYRLTESTKRSISESKKGQRHREETKDKISKSLIVYFRRKNPLSEEIIQRYCRFGEDDIFDWANEVRDDLDCIEDVMTRKAMSNTRRIELSCGGNIEYFSHNLTPEVIFLYKEYCRIEGLDINEAMDA